jgi:hypothetical protein
MQSVDFIEEFAHRAVIGGSCFTNAYFHGPLLLPLKTCHF